MLWAQSTTTDYIRAKTNFNLSPIYPAHKGLPARRRNICALEHNLWPALIQGHPFDFMCHRVQWANIGMMFSTMNGAPILWPLDAARRKPKFLRSRTWPPIMHLWFATLDCWSVAFDSGSMRHELFKSASSKTKQNKQTNKKKQQQQKREGGGDPTLRLYIIYNWSVEVFQNSWHGTRVFCLQERASVESNFYLLL